MIGLGTTKTTVPGKLKPVQTELKIRTGGGLHGHQLLDACGYVATPSQTKRQKHGKPFPEHILEAKTVVVSCGMTNFEDSNCANGKSNEFAEWNRGYRIERGHLNKYPVGKEKFL